MIEFRCRKIDRRNNNTPILSDAEIDEFALAVLKDYKPALLKEPGKIKFQHFLESYLGVNLEFHDIYYEEDEKPILGATAFSDGKLKIFNKEDMCISSITVCSGTVIIDNSVMEEGKEGLALFTGLHEGGHVLIHPGVYSSGCPGQMNLFSEELSPIVCCRKGSIESSGTFRKKRTPEEWREHHADYFAAAISMPKPVFIPVARNLMREHNIYKDHITYGVDDDMDYIAHDLIPESLSEVFGVSKTAAFIKLKKCELVMDKPTHDMYHAQQKL